jgi:DNA repair protein RecO
VSLNYAEPINSPLMWGGGEALGYAGYFAELIDEWAPEADPNETLYRLGSATVDALVAGADIEPLARYFEYWLLRLQGVYPSVLACAACDAGLGRNGETAAVLLPGDHQFLCAACARGTPGVAVVLSGESVAFLRAAGTTSPGRIGAAGVSKRTLGELEAVHRSLIATHLEKQIRSVRVLREIRGH